MWEYYVLAIFIIGLQLAFLIVGGYLSNFVVGIIGVISAVYYFNLIGSGLALEYILPLIMVIMTLLLWVDSLNTSDMI